MTPFNGKLLVKKIEKKKESLIIMTPNSDIERFVKCRVVAAADYIINSGQKIKLDIIQGDIVIVQGIVVSDEHGVTYELDGEKLFLIDLTQVIGTVD